MNERSHISLFTGAGGLDLGLEQAGFTTLVAVEKNAHSRQTLDYNRELFRYPELEVFEDVNAVTGEDILVSAGLRRGDLDLLSGGPPCQSYSTAGRRRAMTDPRGNLFGRFLELVGEIQPRFFVLENVRGVLSAAIKHRPLAERGAGHPPLEPEEELGSLFRFVILPWIKDQLDYQVSVGLVNSADYGVPQVRNRAIFIGSRDRKLGKGDEGCDSPKLSTLLPVTYYEVPKDGELGWKTLGDALEGLEQGPSEGARYSPARAAVLDNVPPGKNWRFLRGNFGEAYLREVMGGAYESSGGKVGFWRRLCFEKACPTLPASPVQKATSLCHPDETRPLNVQEYARVQEFPDGYCLAGTTSSKYTQIGNAVPVGLARAIGEAVVRVGDNEVTPHQGQLFRTVQTST